MEAAKERIRDNARCRSGGHAPACAQCKKAIERSRQRRWYRQAGWACSVVVKAPQPAAPAYAAGHGAQQPPTVPQRCATRHGCFTAAVRQPRTPNAHNIAAGTVRPAAVTACASKPITLRLLLPSDRAKGQVNVTQIRHMQQVAQTRRCHLSRFVARPPLSTSTMHMLMSETPERQSCQNKRKGAMPQQAARRAIRAKHVASVYVLAPRWKASSAAAATRVARRRALQQRAARAPLSSAGNSRAQA